MLNGVNDDDVSDEHESLPGNPAIREVVPSAPTDRTAMIDREAIEAKRAARRAAESPRDADDDVDSAHEENTPPPAPGARRDPDATGTLARRRQKSRGGTAHGPRSADLKNGEGEDGHEGGYDDGAEQDDASALAERTSRDDARGARARTGFSRHDATKGGAGTGGGTGGGNGRGRAPTGADAEREGTRTGLTRATMLRTAAKPAPPRRPLSPFAAAAAVVLGVIGLIGAVVVASRATGVLTVTTVPHGATVTLDGEVIGTSPLQKRVRTGAHTIELSLQGYEPFREVIEVPSSGWPFLQPLKALPPPPPPPPTSAEIAADEAAQVKRLFDAGDLDGALAKVVEIERLVPDHAPSAALRRAVHEADDKRRDSLRQNESQAAFAGQLARARQLAAQGRQFYDGGKLGPARTALFQSLKLDPKNPDPHRTLAKIFNRENDVVKVRYHLERFLELGGNDADFKVREWLRTHTR
jgi:hypothetical protein